jgi:hypothetical protein
MRDILENNDESNSMVQELLNNTVENSAPINTQINNNIIQQMDLNYEINNQEINNEQITHINNNINNQEFEQRRQMEEENDYIFPHEINNEEKGDSIYSKYKNTMRFTYLNANSMRAPKLDKWKAYLDAMEEVQIDVLGLNETCINMNLTDTRQQFQNVLTKKFRNSSMSISKTKTNIREHIYLEEPC